MGGPSSPAANLAAAEQALHDLQVRLVSARTHMAQLNATMQRDARAIQDDQHTVDQARLRLASLVRDTYMLGGGDGFTDAILSSGSFTQAIDRVRGAQHVTSEVYDLQATVSQRQDSLRREQSQVKRDFAAASALESQLNAENAQMLALVAQFDAQMAAAGAPVRQVATQIAGLDGIGSAGGSSPCGNHFAYGQCTWYVATRRCIPWFGNAGQWYSAAAAYGYPEGRQPVPGAVAVWGSSGTSPVGHVAYVEAVGPASGVPPGSFLISEMNWSGWDRVDRRVVPDNDPSLLGFIYGH